MNQLVQRIQCDKHNKEVHFICCELNCSQSIFCTQCLRNQTHISHNEKVFTIEEFINESSDDIWQGFQQHKRSNFNVEELSHFVDSKKKELIEMIEKEFKGIQSAIRSYSDKFSEEKERVGEIQKKVKDYISQNAQLSDVSSAFQSFHFHFNQRMEQFLQFDYERFSFQLSQIHDNLKDFNQQLFEQYVSFDETVLKQCNQQIHSKSKNPSSMLFSRNQQNNDLNDNQMADNINLCQLRSESKQVQDSITATLALTQPIKRIKIEFSLKQCTNQFAMRFITPNYEGSILSHMEQDIYKLSAQNQLQKIGSSVIDFKDKRFSLSFSKESSYMLLKIEDNNTFVIIHQKDQLDKKNSPSLSIFSNQAQQYEITINLKEDDIKELVLFKKLPDELALIGLHFELL